MSEQTQTLIYSSSHYIRSACQFYTPQMADCLDLPDVEAHCSHSLLCVSERALQWQTSTTVETKKDVRRTWGMDIAPSNTTEPRVSHSNKAQGSVWSLHKRSNNIQDSQIVSIKSCDVWFSSVQTHVLWSIYLSIFIWLEVVIRGTRANIPSSSR